MSAPSPNFASHVRRALNDRRRRLQNLLDAHGHLAPHQHEELADLRAALVAMEDPRVSERMISSYMTS